MKQISLPGTPSTDSNPPLKNRPPPLPARFLAIVLFGIICLWGGLYLLDPPYEPARASALHTLLETLYVAGISAIFSIAWYTPRGEYRRRLALIACLCVPAGLFGLLHFLTHPGMPDLLVANNPAMSFYFKHIAHLATPLAFLALVLASPSAPISINQRWSALAIALAVSLPLAAYGFTLSEEQAPRILSNASGLHILAIALFLSTPFLARYRAEMENPDSCYLYYACILGALAEICLIPDSKPGISTPLNLLGHIYSNLSIFTFFVALYGEAVRHPYAQLRHARDAARDDAERLNTVLHSSTDGLIVTDTNLRIQSANPAIFQILGHTEPDLAGSSLGELLAPLDEQGHELTAKAADCLRYGRLRGEILTHTRHNPAKDLITIEYSVSPVSGNQGQSNGVVLMIRDITGESKLRQQLLESANYARNLFDSTPDAAFTIGPDGIVSDVNIAAEKATNRNRRQLVGSHFPLLFSDPVRAHEAQEDAIAGAKVHKLALALKREGGGILHVNCHITPYFDETRCIKGAFAALHDVTDMHQALIQLQFQSKHDALTALPNRRAFHDHLARTIAPGDDISIAVMVIDLDDFKDINDTLGPIAGDDLLKEIASRLTRVLGNSGLVARLGGDEFAVLVASTTHTIVAEQLADELRASISAPIQLAGRELIVNSSIGISLHPEDSGDADSLLKNADTAVYHAKKNGKNHWQRFKPEMNDALLRRIDIAQHLRHALARSELTLHYQPQVNLQGNEVVGVEALLRWHSAELGTVSPFEFIPVAEETGLILPIGTWVLEEACRQGADWRATLGIELGVAINLSARQFRDNSLTDQVKEALATTGLPPFLLELELTESMVMHDAAGATATMTALKGLGAKLSIDDFGTGYSSLAYLKRFPIDSLKIDRSFVMDIPGDANDTAIVRSILAMAHGLGLKVVAEGAETDRQMDFLRNHGCDIVQGYFVSRPLPANDVPAFLERWHETLTPPPVQRHPETGVTA